MSNYILIKQTDNCVCTNVCSYDKSTFYLHFSFIRLTKLYICDHAVSCNTLANK